MTKSIRMLLTLLALVLPLWSVQGQTNQSSIEPSAKSEKADSPVEQNQTASENRELKSKIEKLQAVMEQQQQLLLELKKRVDELEHQPHVAVAAHMANLSYRQKQRVIFESAKQIAMDNRNMNPRPISK